MPPQQSDHHAHHKFDDATGNYQTNKKNQPIAFAGETDTFFAHYKAQKIAA